MIAVYAASLATVLALTFFRWALADRPRCPQSHALHLGRFLSMAACLYELFRVLGYEGAVQAWQLAAAVLTAGWSITQSLRDLTPKW